MTFYIIAIWKLMTIIAIYLFFILYSILSLLQTCFPKKLNDCKGWIKCSWLNLTKPYFVKYSTKNKDLKILSFYGTNHLQNFIAALLWLNEHKESLTISSFFYIKLKIKNKKSCIITSWDELDLIIQDLRCIFYSREEVKAMINQNKLIKL